MKTFYVSRNLKIRTLFFYSIFFFIPVMGLSIWTFSQGIHAILRPNPLAKILGLFFLGFGIVPFLLALWMGLWIYSFQKTKLVLDSLSIQLVPFLPRFKFLNPRGNRPFNIKYEQIKIVKGSEFSGVIYLIDDSGTSTQVFANLFGENKGEDVLLELKKHLPQECFDSQLAIAPSKRRVSKTDIFQIILSLGLIIGIFFMAVLEPVFPYRSIFLHAWKIEQNLPFTQSSEVLSAKSENDFWTITDSFGDYTVYHKKDGKVTSLSVPEINEDEKLQFISEDENGNPILWLDKRVVRFDKNWQSVNYPASTQIDTYMPLHRFVVKGRQALYIESVKKSTDRLVLMDAVSGSSTEIALPETAKQENLDPFQITLALNGHFIVSMIGNTSMRVYLLSENGWNQREYPLSSSPLLINDIFLDQQGSLWFLFKNQSVEKVDINGVHYVTQLPPTHGEGDDYETLLIDSRERLWVYGGYPEFMAVFQPRWNSKAVELEYYTPINSNFSLGGLTSIPVMVTNGIILAPGHSITSMDTNLEIPPAPLTGWLGTQDPRKLNLFFIFYQLFLLTFIFVTVIRRRKATLRQ